MRNEIRSRESRGIRSSEAFAVEDRIRILEVCIVGLPGDRYINQSVQLKLVDAGVHEASGLDLLPEFGTRRRH